MHNKTTKQVLTILSPSILLRALAMDIFIPCLPVVAMFYEVPLSHAQWVLSIFFIGSGLGQLFLGPLSDRFGRRPIILCSIILFALSSLACAFASTINILILMRLLQGVGASGTTVIVIAIIRDLYEDHMTPRIYSYVSAIIGLAPLFAPLLGGTLLVLTMYWQSVFYFVVLFSIFTFIVSYMFLSETSPKHSKSPVNNLTVAVAAELGAGIFDANAKQSVRTNIYKTLRNYKLIFTEPGFLKYLGCATVGLCSLFLYFSASSVLFIKVLGVSANIYGLYFACNSLVYMIGNILSPKLVRKFGVDKVIVLGNLAVILGALCMLSYSYFFELSVSGVLLPTCIITFGVGWMYGPCAAGAMREFKAIAGTASASYGAVLYCVTALIVTAIMQLEIISAWPLAIAMLLFGCTGLLLSTWKIKH